MGSSLCKRRLPKDYERCSLVERENENERFLAETRVKAENAFDTNLSTSESNQLTADEIRQYTRQMILPEISQDGQNKLKASRVLIVGCGGIGSPSAIYLCGAGIGTLGLIDGDTVEASNLHRQIIHNMEKIGMQKTQSAKKFLNAFNPFVKIITHEGRFSEKNAQEIVKNYDVVLDGSDNARTRYQVNDACVLENKVLVSGASVKWEGQFTVYNYQDGPCYRCLYPECPKAKQMQSCVDNGVVGMLPGIVGQLEALECVKIILGMEGILKSRMVFLDGKDGKYSTVRIRGRMPKCAVCSQHNKTIFSVKEFDYDEFTGVSCANAQPVAQNDGYDKSIDVDWKYCLDYPEEHIYLDVRPKAQFDIINFQPQDKKIKYKFLDDLVNLEIDKQKEFLPELEENKKIFCFCRRGRASGEFIDYQNKLGYKNCNNVTGGLRDYCKDIDDQVPSLI